MFWTGVMIVFVKKKGIIFLEGALFSSTGSQYICWGAQVFFQPGVYCLTDYCPNSTLAITPRRRSLH